MIADLLLTEKTMASENLDHISRSNNIFDDSLASITQKLMLAVNHFPANIMIWHC